MRMKKVCSLEGVKKRKMCFCVTFRFKAWSPDGVRTNVFNLILIISQYTLNNETD